MQGTVERGDPAVELGQHARMTAVRQRGGPRRPSREARGTQAGRLGGWERFLEKPTFFFFLNLE